MSYATISTCVADMTLQGRVNAALAKEGVDNPYLLIGEMMWKVASAPDIAAAYASALAADNPDPGGDEAVVTDQMILSAVQANMPAAP